MSNKLLIVESPSKAKTISKYLNGEYKVIASVGHIRDLPKSNKKAIDIENGYLPHYEIIKGKEKVVAEIKREAQKADYVCLATDPDREGEAIAWHIKEAIELKNPKRVVFYEITKETISEALENPREIDQDLRKAQEARRVLDRLVGYELSGLIWKKIRYGLSAGRVQSPALRIIVEREREIKNFIPKKYFIIEADTETSLKDPVFLICEEQPETENRAEQIKNAIQENTLKVSEVEKTRVKRSPRAPFTTSTLQQTASSRLGFSPSRTMLNAQKLYESGFITYMRTDSTNLNKQAQAQIISQVEREFGQDFAQAKSYATKSKNAQEAHEAIRPTNISVKTCGHSNDQKKLYELIRNRALSSQMRDAEIDRTKISVEYQKDMPLLSANGSTVSFLGWLKADPASRGEEKELPRLEKGEELKLSEVRQLEKQTEPPSRITEAGLIKELEKRGIGRPSTYASIIKTLIDRHYVEKEGKALKPTDTGEVVSGFLEEHFAKYISDEFTALMEDDLDEIALGKRDYAQTLDEIYKPLSIEIKSKEKIAKANNLGESDKFICPKCAGKMVIKLGRGGKFLSCANFPDCDGALTIDGYEIKADQPIGSDPNTGLPIFLKIGRFGPYLQLGEKKDKKSKEAIKPKNFSIPKFVEIDKIDLELALKIISLPKTLGVHPKTNLPVIASVGRFGPYVVHDGNFRSLKEDNVFEIKLERALELLAQEKPKRGFRKKSK